MTALTLPGSIPGLLRRGSPVRHDGAEYVVVDEEDGRIAIARWSCPAEVVGPLYDYQVDLDLSDATGRAHAAWWAERECWGMSAQVAPDHIGLIRVASQGWGMSRQQNAALRDLVLRFARVTP